MKTAISLLSFLMSVTIALSQSDITYFSPQKSFKVTVTFTQSTKKRIKKSTADTFNQVVATETSINIKDDIVIEEIVMPDYSNPKTLHLPKIGKSGASFNYAFQWSENGLGSSFNASREPVVVSIISGAVGLISSGIAVFAKAGGIGAAPAAATYEEVVDETKFKVVTWWKIDCSKSDDQIELRLDDGYMQGTAKPKVVLAYKQVAKPSNSISSGSGDVVVKAKLAATYQIEVTVMNPSQPAQKVISSLVQLPQCGVDVEYKFDIIGGKRTVAFEMDPSTGGLKKVEYKKESNWKASQESIKQSLDQVAALVDQLNKAKDDKEFESINQEISRLKKQNEKLQELKNKMELEKAISGTP